MSPVPMNEAAPSPTAIVSSAVAIVSCLLIALLAGCGTPARFTGDEAHLVAWFVEDFSHGLDRNADELATDHGSTALQQIYRWMHGSASAGAPAALPRQLVDRRRRWAMIRPLLAQHLLVVLPSGLLTDRPGISPSDRDLAQSPADDEDRDRKALDLIILSLARADNAMTRRYLDDVRQARLTHDLAAGGQLWKGALPADRWK